MEKNKKSLLFRCAAVTAAAIIILPMAAGRARADSPEPLPFEFADSYALYRQNQPQNAVHVSADFRQRIPFTRGGQTEILASFENRENDGSFRNGTIKH